MSKKRYITTSFWRDTFIDDLDPVEKLVFLYLICNPATNLCGIYELPMRIISSDTGIDDRAIKNIFTKFATKNKMFYVDGWVLLCNAPVHQDLANPKIKKGLERELSEIPSLILDKINSLSIPYTYPMDSTSHFNFNFNLNLNSNLAEGQTTPQSGEAVPAIPTLEEVKEYALQRNSPVDPEYYWEKNNVNGWVTGKDAKPIRSWKSNFLVWEKFEKERLKKEGGTYSDLSHDMQNKYSQFHRVIQALEGLDEFKDMIYENVSLAEISKEINIHMYGETQVPSRVIGWITDNNLFLFMLGQYKTIKGL